VTVRDGAFTTPAGPSSRATLEGKIVCLFDRVAYITPDIDDAVRAGVRSERPSRRFDRRLRYGVRSHRRARPRSRRALRGGSDIFQGERAGAR